jgi:transcriptional regulator with XRE-family HTH domain
MMIEPAFLRKMLSSNIKRRRKILGISQEKLAELTELSSQTVNDIEGCRMWVSDKTIAKLCGALQIEAYQLLLPPIGKIDISAPTPSDILLSLRENLKETIDTQFSELLKSGVFR